MHLNFILDQFRFELSCKKMETWQHTHMDAHTDTGDYSIVAFCKNATTTS